MPYADYNRTLKANRERQKTPVGAANHLKANKKYRAANRKKMAAHNAIAKAILYGKITALPCFICGEKAEAHHPDYDAPLSVVWLCSPHHKQAHALAKRII